MGVLNGARHLPAQLDSIARQRHRDWRLVCGDDGSTDDSVAILRRFAADHPRRVTLLSGPRAGFAQNYLFLLRTLPDPIGAVAFADQDDIWLPGKLSRGVSALAGAGDGPALYCGRRILWFDTDGWRTASPAVARPCTLRNALVENVAAGNTVVLNPSGAALARRAAARIGPVFAHDWWLYLLMTAAGGCVHFDNGPPQILYRQHGANRIGAPRGIGDRLRRKAGVIRGDFAARVGGNLAALHATEDLLTPAARQLIADFDSARRSPALSRLATLRALRPYRQRFRDTLGFWGAAGLGRI